MVVVSEVALSPPSTSPPSLRGPCPRTPPSYPDLYGKYRLQKQIQILNREIGFLEEELTSLDGLPPASRFCKEVEDFVREHPDPLVPIKRTIRRSHRIWRILRVVFCCNLSCFRYGSGCSIGVPKSFDCNVTKCWRWCCAAYCCTCKPCYVLPNCPDCRCCKPDCTCTLPDCSCCAPECGCLPDCSTCCYCKLPRASCPSCRRNVPDCSCCIPDCRCSLPDCSCCIPNYSCCICSCPKCPRISCSWTNSSNICCIPSWLC
ncbi:guanine nucleotide-binding protein subunit gamma 3-like [Nymphaea colorata]|nr:guanine nucleotide-binding protein subunit gamma 3-like [Nymphaea colorata]